MGALTIAFDTTIVGALALPWVILVIHLFFFEGENHILEVLHWVQKSKMTAVAGVLLFTIAYTLGSVVSRLGQDFFNDDDLYVQFSEQMYRFGTTENRIISSVYCQNQDNGLLPDHVPAITSKVNTFTCQKLKAGCSEPGRDNSSVAQLAPPSPQEPNRLCDRVLRWHGDFSHNDEEDNLIGTARDLFGLEESALMLKGEDDTLRLRQFHDQVMVLRGAAFNGLVAMSFCIFAWCSRWRRAHPDSLWRWLLLAIPLVPVACAIEAGRHHFSERAASDPPYMEFSLLIIGIAGLILLRPYRSIPKIEKEPPIHLNWPALSVLSLVLTFTVTLGWWATEVLYAQEVIYSYDSQAPVDASDKGGSPQGDTPKQAKATSQ